MSTSYSDLQQYRACPRLFSFHKLGYIPAKTTEPLATGSLVHIGLAAHFKGLDGQATMNAALETNYTAGISKLSGADRYEYEETLSKASARAKELFKRYITHWAKDYEPIFVEQEFEMDSVVCHMDLVAKYRGQRVIVDYKTSYHPDERWYDISGQLDLYAYVEATYHGKVSMVIYDVISEEGIFQHMRPPRLEAGERLFVSIKGLNAYLEGNKRLYPHAWEHTLLDVPYPDYTCPTRCFFWIPCWLLETDTWETCRDYLEENYLK